MRRLALAATALVAVAAPIAVVAAPASAAYNPPCATRAEFRAIHTGQSLTKVASIVGSRGRVSMSSPYVVIRQWKTCGNPYGNMTIGFSGGRVQSKIFIG